MSGLSRRTVLAGLPLLLAGGTAGGAVTWGAEEEASASTGKSVPPSTLSPAEVRGQVRTVWSAPRSAGAVALTFDDGPTLQFTAQVLAVLARFEVQATFFMIGTLVEQHPDLARQVHDAGHEVANHSYDHRSAAVSNAVQVRESLLRGADCLEEVTGRRPRWYRPPRGEVTSASLLAAAAGAEDLALWSVERGTDVADGDGAGFVEHLTALTGAGDVVDLHDGIGRSSFVGHPDPVLLRRRRTEISALPRALAYWQDVGLSFRTLSELVPEQSGR
jgi:peptidoglycan/xylan/chitin deacetylase (PgdA/CDA1 family)